jgi:hypothetical protein
MPRPSQLPGLRARPARVGRAVLALALAGAAGTGAQADDGASRRGRLDAFVASIGAYVERFQAEMEAAVLEESYVQLLRQPCCREPRKPGEDPLLAWDETRDPAQRRGLLARRQLKSEVLLVRISGGMRVGYRDVYEVDGKAIHDRSERVRRLFLSGTQESALALGRIAAESARFNLGQVQRTTNLPTLPLLYLVPAMHPRLYFSRGGDEEVDGMKTTILEFREDASPTLAASAAGIDMPARGRAWVEPATGRIRRIELRFAPEVQRGARRVMTVWFREDSRIGVLAPARMWEWYEKVPIGDELAAGDSKRAWPADVEALATYTNLRLFSVETSEDIGETAE